MILCLSKLVVPVSGSVSIIFGPSSSRGPPVGEDGVAQLNAHKMTTRQAAYTIISFTKTDLSSF